MPETGSEVSIGGSLTKPIAAFVASSHSYPPRLERFAATFDPCPSGARVCSAVNRSSADFVGLLRQQLADCGANGDGHH